MSRRRRRPHAAPTVVHCYSVMDKFLPIVGCLDYSEGLYYGDPTTPYEQAQRNQLNYLLDEVRCREGTRVLEIGCGNGTLLDAIRRRGGVGVGITISPEQVDLCRRRGLDVRLLNCRDLDDSWNHRFDAVVANGPIEHFVQPHDAVAGKADEIYTESFRVFHRAIDPQSPIRRLANTTIHFLRRPDPAHLLKPPSAFPRDSDNLRWASLQRSFGGFYPEPGQFERCAKGRFKLVHTTDGTYDYHLTSEEWLRRIRAALRTPTALRILGRSLPIMVRHPAQFASMVRCMLITEAWNWQFRPPDPPTQLLRQTWEYCA